MCIRDSDPAYPINRQTRLMEVSGQRQTMLEDFVCESRAMATVLDEILTVSKYDCNVLITGDTGVGKEKVANIIYKNSNRKMQPFIKVNCASISPTLIESEFFGYEKGAFTGANASGKKGYFELADNCLLYTSKSRKVVCFAYQKPQKSMKRQQEKQICRQTCKPGRRFRIEKRGIIKEGHFADLAVNGRAVLTRAGSGLVLQKKEELWTQE